MGMQATRQLTGKLGRGLLPAILAALTSLLVALPMAAQTNTPTATATEVILSERQALVAFFSATGGVNWTNSTNWRSATEPLGNWYGVTMDDSGAVSHLELRTNNLTGSILTALSNLSKLERLDLSDNTLTGSIPQESRPAEIFLRTAPTNTSIPPTITPLPSDTPILPTATPVPPTSTPIPPPATPVPPTNTPIPQQPGRASGLTASQSGDSVSLSWSAPGDGGQVTGYRIWRRLPD